MIKADCLKFLIDVRNQIDRNALLVSLSECVKYLSSSNVVVHTYAAHAIERLLLVRSTSNPKETAFVSFSASAKRMFPNKTSPFPFRCRITKADLMPHCQTMFENFFRLLTSEKGYENEYVMRAVMRLSSSLQETVLPYLSILMDKLVNILRRSCRVKIKQSVDEMKPENSSS